jgi:hypothetical protein
MTKKTGLTPATALQPEAKIIDNAPAATLKAALANAAAQVDAAAK